MRDESGRGQRWARGWAGGRTLVVVYNISQVVPAAVMRLAHAHRVVRKVDVAVVAYFL